MLERIVERVNRIKYVAKILVTNYWTTFIALICVQLSLTLVTSNNSANITSILDNEFKNGFLKGFVLSAQYISTFLTVIYFAYYSEWSLFGRMIIMLIGQLFVIGCMVGFYFAKNAYVYLILFLLIGIGTASCNSSSYPLLIDSLDADLVNAGIYTMEFSVGLFWTVCPKIFYEIKKKVERKVFLVVAAIQAVLLILSILFNIKFFYKKSEFRDKVKKKKSVNLVEGMILLLSNKKSILSIIVNISTCAAYYAFSAVFWTQVPEDKLNLYYILPSPIIGFGLLLFISSLLNKEKFLIYSLLPMGACYFLHSRFIIQSITPNQHDVFYIVFLLIRDVLYYISYVFCSLVIVNAIALKKQDYEVNGFCTAMFVYSTSLGNTIGLIYGNGFYPIMGFDFVSIGAASLLFVVFIGTFVADRIFHFDE